jgi:hypothetical protein
MTASQEEVNVRMYYVLINSVNMVRFNVLKQTDQQDVKANVITDTNNANFFSYEAPARIGPCPTL